MGFGVLLIYLIGRKTVKLKIPLCAFHARRKRRLKMTAIAFLIGFIPVGALVGNLAPDPDGAAWGMGVGLLMCLTGLIAASLQTPLQAVRIDSDWARLKGTGADFLARLAGLSEKVSR